jgi:hypothetical protein
MGLNNYRSGTSLLTTAKETLQILKGPAYFSRFICYSSFLVRKQSDFFQGPFSHLGRSFSPVNESYTYLRSP